VITPDQARVHPRRNIVTRALGTDPAPRPDYWLLPAKAGERFLLCSDGLYTEVEDERIAVLLASGSPQVAAPALVAAAEEAGGHDNITVLVVDVVGFGDLATPASAAIDETRADITPQEGLRPPFFDPPETRFQLLARFRSGSPAGSQAGEDIV
jgi:serine/threonine protein phosphatase PrpC